MLGSKVMTTESKILMLGSKVMMTESKIMAMESNILMTDPKIMVMESNILMTDSKIMMTESKIMAMSSHTQRRGDVEPPGVAECTTVEPPIKASAHWRVPMSSPPSTAAVRPLRSQSMK
jgi:hypothetical protein